MFSRRGACFIVASGSHPHVLFCMFRFDAELREGHLVPTAYSTAGVFKVLQAYGRIMFYFPIDIFF